MMFEFVSRLCKGCINVFEGCVDVTVENVQDLITAADMLQLEDLVRICGDFLTTHMDHSNCVGMYQLLEQMGQSELMESVQNYIHTHFLQVRSAALATIPTPTPIRHHEFIHTAMCVSGV